MENTHPFSLKKSVADWKQSLLARNLVSTEEVAELESHLSDSIDQLTSIGLDEKEAFMLAAHRIGHPCKLEEEFAKVNVDRRWKQRLSWLLIGWISLMIVEQIARASIGTGFAGLYFGWNNASAAWTAAISNVLVWGLGLGSLILISKASWICSTREKWSKNNTPLKSILLLTGIGYSIAFLMYFLIINFANRAFEPTGIGEMYIYYGYTSTFTPVIIMITCLISLHFLTHEAKSHPQ